ncbi:MAG TPA: cytidylate kinase-like family protein [Anaerolineae bacterium]|nr:cytidylate kinase-like family protein [Anaerolineae bacterium]
MSVITISRQLGCDGDEVARLLCERLGYQRFDKNSMTQLGHELGMDAGVIDQATAARSGPRGLLERWFGNFETPMGDPGSWTFQARSDAREAISVDHLRRLIVAGYEKGNTVIVGRGGMAALAGMPNVIHVRIVAPRDLRLKRVQEHDKVSAEEAEQRVYQRDVTDVDWIKRYFGLDAHSPELFDLTINTAKIKPEFAVGLIIETMEHLGIKP